MDSNDYELIRQSATTSAPAVPHRFACFPSYTFGPHTLVAQGIEHRYRKPGVAGSIQAGGAPVNMRCVFRLAAQRQGGYGPNPSRR